MKTDQEEMGTWPRWSSGKESACNARDTGDLGSIPGLGRSPGEGKGYPLQYSGLKNSMACIVHGGHKESDTTERLSVSLRSPGCIEQSSLCYMTGFH